MKLKINNYSHEFDYKFKDSWYYDILTKPGSFDIYRNDSNVIKIYKR